jgi:PAS domain-containing protein
MRESQPVSAIDVMGTALVAPDGRYLDADPVALDLYGVTLDVLRESRIGDFSPPEYRQLERGLWSVWTALGLEHGEGGGTVVRPGGSSCRLWVALKRLPDGNVELSLKALDEPVVQPPALRVGTVLGHWRDLERDLAEVDPDDPAREQLQERIDALREEYQRRTSGR